MSETPRAARQEPARRPVLRSLVVLGVVCAAVIGTRYVPLGGQASRSDAGAAGIEAVERAWLEGRLDAVESLGGVLPGEEAAVLRARAASARGRYEDAERLLEPLAAARPAGQAALELGLLRQALGRRAEADDLLRTVMAGAQRSADAEGLSRAARAARALGRLRDANALFREAAAMAPDDPAVNTAWGELFLDTYNRQEAARSFRAALDQRSDWVPALHGLALALAEDNPPAAARTAQQVLAMNPSWVPAHLLQADLALDADRRDEAEAAIARALEINPRSLEALSLKAAVAYLDDRHEAFEATAADVLAINPVYGEVYRVAAALTARNYRFDEAVELARRGIELDPSNSRTHAELGLHLLRTGDEDDAREALERAFRDDPFDVVTYNLLGLLDTLDRFETFEVGNVLVRLHPDEAGVLREYALPLVEEAFATLPARYGMTPQGPILIEVFPRHDDFAVRNLGLPGMVGALGACFGRVVTMDSPRARPPGSFNWQATLWHEIAHVVTLQMSQQRVPRWLTEGVSVWEERRARPQWGGEMDLPFVRALDRGETLPLSDLNSGFTNPQTIALAYQQASLLVEHLVEDHGESSLHRMLRAYGDGLDTEAVLSQVLDRTFDQIEVSFERWLDGRYGALRQALRAPDGLSKAEGDVEALQRLADAHPGSFPVQIRFAQALLAAGRSDEAVAPLERAASLVPEATGPESPRALLAGLAVERSDREGAMRELETLLARHHTGLEEARLLASLAEAASDDDRRWTAYTRIVELDPFDVSVLTARGRLALTRGDAGTASRDFRAALAAGPVDRAEAHCDLAESYLLLNRYDDARRQAIAALEIAPAYERAQDLLLRAVGEGS